MLALSLLAPMERVCWAPYPANAGLMPSRSYLRQVLLEERELEDAVEKLEEEGLARACKEEVAAKDLVRREGRLGGGGREASRLLHEKEAVDWSVKTEEEKCRVPLLLAS